jgi:aspartate ammonia-lyase
MFESLHLLTNACVALRTKCVTGITANVEVCRRHVLDSIGIVTYLNEIIGHRNGDLVGAEAARTGASVRDVVVARGLLTPEEVDAVLTTENFLRPRYTGRYYAPDERGLPVGGDEGEASRVVESDDATGAPPEPEA